MNTRKEFAEFLETAVHVGALSEETKNDLYSVIFGNSTFKQYIIHVLEKTGFSVIDEKKLYIRLVKKTQFSPGTADMYVTTEGLWLAFKQYQQSRTQNK